MKHDAFAGYPSRMLERWTRGVIRWRFTVIALWVVVLACGVFSAARLPALLTTSLNVPGSDSAQANHVLEHNFAENIEGTFTVVLPLRHSTPALIRTLETRIANAAKEIPTGRLTQDRAVGGLLYANVDTSLSLQRAAFVTPELRHALSRAGLTGALVTGPPALQHDLTPVLSHDLHWGEALAVVLALLLLLAVLGLCWALVIPFAVAATTAGAALVVVYLMAQWFVMVLYVPNVVELIGFGLAVDYSLLIVHRFRSEVEHDGADIESAVVRTMASAGRTVVLSGLSVAIGLTTLLLVPVPFVRALGAAGLAVPLVAICAALTLQPALLSLFGSRGVRPRAIRGLLARRDVLTGAWARIARLVIRRPVTVLVASLVLLGAASTSIFWFQVTPGSITAIPQHLESTTALDLVRAKVGPAVITPIEVVIDSGSRHHADAAAMSAARLRLAELILHDQDVFVVAIGPHAPYVDATGRFARIFVINRHEFGAETSQRLVRAIRNTMIPAARFPAGTRIYVGGAASQGVDFLSTIYGTFPWIVLLALALAYLVLLRAFRSLVLPLLAVLLDLVSVAAAYGLLVVIFRFGVGSSLLGIYHVSQIEGWVPVFIFAVLFGLSSDYEVFIVARMRESWDEGSGNAKAITDGLAHTGGVVTAAAVIMVGALGGLAFGQIAGLQELGVGLALGVLVDATIIRGLMLPSVMALLGRWNWWLPEAPARLARTKASPLEKRGARP
jgi:RND superfamily putative drug exporter